MKRLTLLLACCAIVAGCGNTYTPRMVDVTVRIPAGDIKYQVCESRLAATLFDDHDYRHMAVRQNTPVTLELTLTPCPKEQQ